MRAGLIFQEWLERARRLALNCLRGIQIIFLERRMPGRIWQVYYSVLDRLGVRFITVTAPNGFNVRGFTHCFFIYHEIWEKHDYDIDQIELGKDSIVIDIGANQGFYTLYAASFGAHVYAFEPAPENFKLLEHNVHVNALVNQVHTFKKAVAGECGVVDLFIGLDHRGKMLSGSVSIMDESRGGEAFSKMQVSSISLDQIFQENSIAYCDLLKMDCEGAEYEILKATGSPTFEKIGSVALEYHNGLGARVRTVLENAGYTIVAYHGEEAGIIKARRM